MARTSKAQKGHTGQTASGHTRDVKIERIGPVTIYKRGETYACMTVRTASQNAAELMAIC